MGIVNESGHVLRKRNDNVLDSHDREQRSITVTTIAESGFDQDCGGKSYFWDKQNKGGNLDWQKKEGRLQPSIQESKVSPRPLKSPFQANLDNARSIIHPLSPPILRNLLAVRFDSCC